MDQKMKRFDSNIEQMMNESEVAPPFGMWNRISAQLDAEIAPVAQPTALSPIPQRALYGFIAGALMIGASLVTAYVVNQSNKQDKQIVNTQPAAITPAIVNQAVTNTPVTNPVVQIQALNTTAEKTTTKPLAVKSSKPVAMDNPVIENTQVSKHEEKTETTVLPAHAEVLIPTQVAENNAVAVSEPYFFPAVDNITAPETKKEKAVVAKTTVKTEKAEDRERTISLNNDPPRIKFRPKKHRSFSYGKIISKKR